MDKKHDELARGHSSHENDMMKHEWVTIYEMAHIMKHADHTFFITRSARLLEFTGT